jgi:hypothetical protein
MLVHNIDIIIVEPQLRSKVYLANPDHPNIHGIQHLHQPDGCSKGDICLSYTTRTDYSYEDLEEGLHKCDQLHISHTIQLHTH